MKFGALCLDMVDLEKSRGRPVFVLLWWGGTLLRSANGKPDKIEAIFWGVRHVETKRSLLSNTLSPLAFFFGGYFFWQYC